MSYLGTFDGFTTSRLAIYAAQQGLKLTGNNIANINTKGYTRQVLDQVSLKTGGYDRYASKFDVHSGTGVLCTGISQIRDPYLDIRYRTENSSVGAMDTKLSGLNDLAAILDEVGKGENDGDGILYAQMSKFLEALEALNTYPGQQEYDILARAEADTLVTLFNDYAGKLETLHKNAEDGFKQDIDEVNEILTNIRDLNSSIRRSEIHGDSALEKRDERNRLIDELSKYMKIDVTYEEEDLGGGQTVEKLVIKLGNANPDAEVKSDSAMLVNGVYAAKLRLPEKVPQANPDYDPEKAVADPDNPDPVKELWAFKYLDENGEGTNDPKKAAQVDNTNYDLSLTKMVNALGQAWEEASVKQTRMEDTWSAKAAVYSTALTEAKNIEDGATITVNGVNISVKDDGSGDITSADANNVRTLMAVIAKKLNDPATNPNPYSDYNVSYENGALTFTAKVPGAAGNNPPAFTIAATNPGGATGDTTVGTLQQIVAGRDEDLTKKPADDGQKLVTSEGGVETTVETSYVTRGDYAYKVVTTTRKTETVDFDDNDLYGSLQAKRELLTEEGEFSSEDVIGRVDENASIKRGIPYYQKSLDLLARQFATVFNEANNGYAVDQDGNYLAKDGSKIMLAGEVLNKNSLTDVQKEALINAGFVQKDKNGQPVLDKDKKQIADPTDWLKNMADTDKYGDKAIDKMGGNMFSVRGDTDADVDENGQGITASNISIAQSWPSGNVHIVTSYVKLFGGEVNNTTQTENIAHMVTLIDKATVYNPQDIDPDSKSSYLFEGSFQEMMNNMCSNLGDDRRSTNVMLNNYYGSSIELDTSRDGVSGVDLNDETMNMMQYQKALTAAYRVMTTIDEALDRLITNTGIVGR